MTNDDAKDLLKQYEQHWGEGKRFDITVESKSNDLPLLLLTALNHPERLTDDEVKQLFNSIQITTLMFKQHMQSKDAFMAVAQETLSRLSAAIQSHNTSEAMLLVDVLGQLAFAGEVKR